MPGPDERDMHSSFDHYLTALGFLAKTDVHMQFEPQSFLHFFQSFKRGPQVYGHWDGSQDFKIAAKRILELRFPFGTGDLDASKMVDIGKKMAATLESPPPLITRSEVGSMKILCDTHFSSLFANRC
jgi:hypothetical protein